MKEMEQYSVGQVTIGVQNEHQPNKDYYEVQLKPSDAIPDARTLEKTVNTLEDPERLIVEKDSTGALCIYSRQPDAIVDIARLISEKHGSKVTDEEVDRVKSVLMGLQ